MKLAISFPVNGHIWNIFDNKLEYQKELEMCVKLQSIMTQKFDEIYESYIVMMFSRRLILSSENYAIPLEDIMEERLNDLIVGIDVQIQVHILHQELLNSPEKQVMKPGDS
jgi:hypothetical protein